MKTDLVNIVSVIMRLAAAVIMAALFVTGAFAGDSPTINVIEVKGLRRVDEGAVRERMNSALGGELSASVVSGDIKEIFSMGYFDDVRVEVEPFEGGVKVVFVMQEKPTVRSVEVYGMEEVSEDDLREALTITPGAIADEVLIQDNVIALKKVCEEDGYPLAVIMPVLKRVGEGGLTLAFQVSEGPKVKVRSILFTGNANIKSKALLDSIESTEWWMWSWLTGNGYYERQKLDHDVELIKDYYHNEGYIKCVVKDPRIEFVEGMEWMDLVYEIQEGARYKLESVSITGNEVFDETRLRDEVKSRAGQYISRKTIREDIESITDTYTQKGYALANVYPAISTDEEAHTARVTFRVSEGDRYKVGRIDIKGNVATRDKVIRREFRLNEGDYYDSAKLKRSYQRINNLNYFDKLRVNPKPDAQSKTLGIEVDAVERSMGSLNVGGGYSTVDKFVGMADVTFGNWGGNGQVLKLSTEFSSSSTTYEISFTDPWFRDKEVSFTGSIYKTSTDYDEYTKDATGFKVGLGKSFAEYWSAGATYNLEEATVIIEESEDEDGDGEPDTTVSSVILSQEGTAVTSSITPNIKRDTRDNYLDPHTGSRNQASVTYAGIGGDNKFLKLNLDSTLYFPITKRTTLAARGRYGYAIGLFGEDLPLYERYYVGSAYTLRGLRYVGPVDENGDYIGGSKRLLFNFDYLYPLVEEARIKGNIFFDTGSAYDDRPDWHFSAGLGIKWLSPIGPLSLEWARNLKPEDGETGSRWEFSIGTLF